MHYCEKVREFTKACHPNLPQKPVLLDDKQKQFIAQMVKDEMDELQEANNVADQADAFVDAIYYLCDAAVRNGMNIDPIFRIVHNANMQKVVDGKVKRRKDGKILKPEGWKDPQPLIQREMGIQISYGAF